jgi:AmmeMemoRadiSam system protein B
MLNSKSMEKKVPRLRADIDIFPTSYQGERAFLVKDTLGLIPNPLLLRGEALQIIGLIDGRRDIQDIQLELIRLHGGVFVRAEDIEELISQLDRAFLMDSPHYRQEKNLIIKKYSQGLTRESCLAGTAYPKEPNQLAATLQSILDVENGKSDVLEGKQIAALIAPHIDLDVGKKIYAKAYQSLRWSSPEKVLLLGTGHNLQEFYFSLTTKDFVTPLGRSKTARDWVERIKKTCLPPIIAPHDIDHKNEHSLEFQILFLQHLLGKNFKLMPILCGSFHKVLHRFSRLGEIPGMPNFIDELRSFLGNEKDSVLVVAGVDFSHIGPKFGHRYRASSMLLEAKEHDRSLLEAISRGDAPAFWAEARKLNNKYNVCGFSAIALLLELFSDREGHLLGYDFWMEDATQSAVSFAALAFPV